MSQLTNLQINQSYQGLLNLADSTSGITPTFQTIQDGLGNDIPARVSNSRFVSNNFVSYVNFTPDYMGNGLTTTSSAPIAGSQSGIITTLFYDSGVFEYSALTTSVITATSTSDIASFGFYTAQWVNGYGLSPAELIFSGTSLDVASTGFKTFTFGTNQTFSGTGSGIYFFVLEIRNAGVTPTMRLANKITSVTIEPAFSQQYGFVANNAGTAYQNAWKNSVANNTGILYNNLGLQSSYSQSDITTNFSTTQVIGQGFLLNVAK